MDLVCQFDVHVSLYADMQMSSLSAFEVHDVIYTRIAITTEHLQL